MKNANGRPYLSRLPLITGRPPGITPGPVLRPAGITPRETVFEDQHPTSQMLLPIRKDGQTGRMSVGKGAPARVAGLSSQVTDQQAFWAPSL